MSTGIFMRPDECYNGHMCPAERKTAAEVLAELFARYQTEELTDLSRASGIPRTTLVNWQNKPDTVIRSVGRKYLTQAKEHHVTNDELADKLDRVAGLLQAILTLDSEGRLEETIQHKRRIHRKLA